MKKFVRRFSKVFGALAIVISIFLIYVQATYKQQFEVPVTGIKASKDSAVIARGEYIVMGPGHCWNCHAPDGETSLQTGTKLGLIGGHELKLPFGELYTPNLTPDTLTGIGGFSDEMLARAIRYSVKHDNAALIPFMSYNTMSDSDIRSVISYLRTIKPVRNKVKENSLNIVGKMVLRFIIKPVYPETTPKTHLEPDTSAAYGQYLATSVGNCVGCHTNRDKNTGDFIGAKFAGGYQTNAKGGTFTTPNLTPDEKTGAIVKWKPTDFTHRFRAGAIYSETPMPWKAYQRFSDNDLKALYYFFNSLEPVQNKTVTFQTARAE
ncbi:c-type cytochrome [Dyadobacter sp. CY326]|uniref:c-type cytochrome n=1 Tax=Dyadobacter sp. CY326 TaxID=2907300 RepID=UPI001F27303B|nr:c-type cytochrome [Dyadobacter sp. CY326]MCE7064920.1 cytochrome c [Dyadobacter sp. CY326]